MSFLKRGDDAAGVASIDKSNKPRLSTDTAGTIDTFADDEEPYWIQEGWVPITKSGKQRTPNMIRNELQRYIDASDETQTAILARMGVNNNSFRRFMDPKTYKEQWSAVQNSTYWAAARLLEEERNKPKKATGKRKASSDANVDSSKMSKAHAKEDARGLMARINAVEGVNEEVVYDSCPELVKKIKAFLDQDGVTKADFCRALGNVNNNSLARFLASKHQDACENITYRRAWAFFEKKRFLEQADKSKARLKNEAEHPTGFRLKRPSQWVITARPGSRFSSA